MNSSSGGNYYSCLDPDPGIAGNSPKRKSSKKINFDNNIAFPSLAKAPISFKTCPKFVVIKSTILEKPLKSFNIFLVSKALDGVSSEKLEKITYTREGHLLLLTKSEMQANRFLKITQLPGVGPVSTYLHPTLNVNKGVIFAPPLKDLSESEILEGLKEQKVVDIYKIKRFVDGNLIPTSLHILSFNHFEIPKEVKVGFLNFKVDPYIPSPIQCKLCFSLGHTKNYCKNQTICEECSAAEHDSPCVKIECVNCKHPHRPNNKKCLAIKKRQNIIKIKTINNISFYEATQRCNQQPQEKDSDIPIVDLKEAMELKKKRLQNIRKNIGTSNKQFKRNK